MTLSAAEAKNIKQAPPVDGVLPLFLNRWSPRSYSDREVSDADLAKVFEAARWTSSALNQQPWRFLVARRGSESHRKIFASMQPKGQLWAGSAPVLILLAAKTTFDYKEGENRFALYDLGGAATALCLQATELGLSTRQCASIEPDAMRDAFQIPQEYLPFLVITLGYQGEPEILEDENLCTQEQSPRKRKAMSEIVWADEWEKPAQLG
jgi:nitroreductase